MSLDIKAIETKAEEVAAPVLANLGYEIVACEFLLDGGRWTLRLFIDKEGGVDIDDCARASRSLEDLIEVEEVVPVRYLLEVSSPGIFRPLRKKEDFEKYVGCRVKVKTQEPIDGRQNYKGILTAVAGEALVMEIDSAEYRMPLSAVARAHLDPDVFPQKQKKMN